MTLTQLEYLIALDNLRHFVKAAESCFVTQPTMTMQVHKLEEELGLKIFDRSKQPLQPTLQGKEVLVRAREIVLKANQLVEFTTELIDDISGVVNIGIIPTIAPYLLPLFLTDLMEKYPKLQIQIDEIVTDEIIKRLKTGTIDIGILATPLEENEVLETPIYNEPFVIYLSKEHHLGNKKLVKSSDIKIDDMWLLNEGHCFRSHALNLCGTNRENISELNFQYKTGSLESIVRIIDKQYGYTLLPKLATFNLSEVQKKNVREFALPVPARQISIVSHCSYPRRKIIEVFKKEIQDNIPKECIDSTFRTIVKWR